MADRSVVYRIIANVSGVLAPVAQASAATRKLADDVTSIGKEGDKARKSLDTLGRNAGRVGLIAAAGLGFMVAKAANFEQAMSNVAAATHESEENMNALRDAAIDAGSRTQFSATEAAGAVTALAKAGVDTADILGENGALNGALALAAAGQLEVADAAETMATALTQFKLPGEKAAHVADLLAAGAGKAQGEVSDMANALKFAGVPASELGVSIEETTGAIALFAKSGIIGEQAGTGLRGMLASLTSPSKIAKKTLDDLGISMFDNQGKFIGLAGVADQLQGHMKTLTDEERANALGRIFGNEQLQAANVLYREGGDGVREWTRNVDVAGFAADTAATKTDNLRGDLERLGGALDTALISGGSGSQGALRQLTQSLTGVVDGFNKLPPAAQTGASGLLAAGAVAGGTIWAGSKLVRTISDTREALAGMGPAGEKAGRGLKLATKGVAYLTAGILLYNQAKKQFDVGIDDDDIRRQTELIAAKFGPDIQSQIEATTAAIKEQQAISDEGFGVNLGVVKVFPFSQAAADAQDKVDGLQKSLAELNHQQELADVSAGDFAAQMPIVGDVLRGLTPTVDTAATSHKNMAKFVTIGGKALRFTAEQLKAAKDDYRQQREDARGIGDEFFTLGQKVDKAKVSLGQWLADLEKQAKALEDFTANAKKAADNGLDKGLIKSLEKAGPAGALRMKQLADATEPEIRRANRAWKRGQDAIDDYVDATTKLPKKLKIVADTRQANTALEALIRQLTQLRGAHVDVRLGGTPTFATGGHVRGPGTATSDSIPAYLSNGEYVIKAAAVNRYGTHMFDRLNAMHFAQGGQVGAGSVGGSIDYDRLGDVLAHRLSGVRPLVNSMDVQVKNYDDLARIESRLRSAGSTDGWRKR